MPSFDTLSTLPKSHPHLRLMTGKTPFFASTLDQRFSFNLYVPKSHTFSPSSSSEQSDLLIIIHGTRRQTSTYHNKLKSFCDTHNVVLMTPLFPAGIEDPEDLNNYKNLVYKGIRFDLVLLSMIEQVGNVWKGVRTDQVYMHGFSGGGQFVHRFMYLYPERLRGVSIGAPGRVTLPDARYTWPGGLGNVGEVFRGRENAPDYESIRKIPMQLVVGEEDRGTELLKLAKKKLNEVEEEGGDRVERLGMLKEALQGLEGGGVERVEMRIVPGVGHDGIGCLEPVEEWFKGLITSGTDGGEGAREEKHHGQRGHGHGHRDKEEEGYGKLGGEREHHGRRK